MVHKCGAQLKVYSDTWRASFSMFILIHHIYALLDLRTLYELKRDFWLKITYNVCAVVRACLHHVFSHFTVIIKWNVVCDDFVHLAREIGPHLMVKL